MGSRVGETIPPDESGLDTFQRFAYQAHVAFPYCLSCYFERGVVAIAAEHFEDLLVEETAVVRFLQIKTRDPERGPWAFAHLCQKGGALHSLLRTHRALKSVHEDREIRYEIVLEGAARRREFDGLRAGGAGPTADHVRGCSEGLKIDEDEAREILDRVVVRDGQPLRAVIEARNIESVVRVAGHLSGEAIRNAVKATVELVKAAMLADITPDDWLTGLIAPDTLLQEAAEAFDRKRLTKDKLSSVLSVLEGGDVELLTTVIDDSYLSATALERKLIAAKASEQVLRMAKEYRARASIKAATFRGSKLFDTGAVMDDLDKRLLDLATTVAQEVGADVSADAVWARLHERTHQNPSAFDRRKALGEDPLLLLGEICELSDRCLFGWRGNV